MWLENYENKSLHILKLSSLRNTDLDIESNANLKLIKAAHGAELGVFVHFSIKCCNTN